jgi:hypothetical protein
LIKTISRRAIVFKRTILAGALALFSIGPAGAQSLARSQSPAVSTVPANFAAVQACEAQMRRLAGSNKTLTANYNAERVHDDCVTSTREAIASKEYYRQDQ